MALYLGILPVVLIPIVVATLLGRARDGDRHVAAFLAVFVSVNVCLLAVVAAVDSIEFRYLHDRYLFYLVPLWLIALFVWLARPQVRPRAALTIAFGVALSPALVPLAEMRELPGHWTFHAPGASLSRAVADAVGSDTVARVVLVVLAVALLSSVLRLRERAVPLVAATLMATLLVNGAAAWSTAANPPSSKVFGPSADRRWIDRQVPRGTSVTTLFVSCIGVAPVERAALDWYAFLAAEFFNASVGTAVEIDPTSEQETRIDTRGHLLVGGERLKARYVLAQPDVMIRGRRVAGGTAAGLVLWDVAGYVRVSGAMSTEELRDRVCRGRA